MKNVNISLLAVSLALASPLALADDSSEYAYVRPLQIDTGLRSPAESAAVSVAEAPDAAETAENGDAPIAVLIEETADGSPGRMIVVEGTAIEPAADEVADVPSTQRGSFWSRFRITRGVMVTAPLPVTAVGGRVGVSTRGGMIEIGAQAEYFTIPPSDGSQGATIGGYVQLAPIPGNIGNRFYIRGTFYREYAVGERDIDGLGMSVAIGYRQPLPRSRYLLGAKHAFIEAGIERQKLYNYDSYLITPRFLMAGIVW